VSTTDTPLDVEIIPGYLAGLPSAADHIDAGAITSIEEVGDGNLNLVFIVRDAAGRGVVVKQALPYVRLVGPEWPMTAERARHEADALRAHGALAPELVPALYHFDAERHAIVMEDLSDHRVWRGALNDGERHEGAATDMGVYVARVAFGTSVLGSAAQEQKAALARAVNPELCEITEDLVFTEPYVDAGRNSCLPANEPDARDLASDTAMVAEMGMMKWRFMTNAQALIHGDLHTGSVMVRQDDGAGRSTKAFDSEFAFYGPIGFDIGALWGNYVIAAARAFALGDDDRAAWALSLVGETWDAFEAELRRLWPRRVDPRVLTDAALDQLIADVRLDSAGFAAAKAARRIVGLAKTSDIETLPEDLREGAARGVLRAARMIATTRHADADPRRLADRAGECLLAARIAPVGSA
jgi:5-methylthioribose kinase